MTTSVKNPTISNLEWQRVLAAYRQGQEREREHWRALKSLGDSTINEDRVRADLKRLAKWIGTCHDDTLRVIEVQMPTAGDGRPVLSSTLLAYYVSEAQDALRRPNEGPPAPWRHRETARVLRELWPDNKARGRGNPFFNPMVQWMGAQLQKLDPSLNDEDNIDAARQAAWNALSDLGTAR